MRIKCDPFGSDYFLKISFKAFNENVIFFSLAKILDELYKRHGITEIGSDLRREFFKLNPSDRSAEISISFTHSNGELAIKGLEELSRGIGDIKEWARMLNVTDQIKELQKVKTTSPVQSKLFQLNPKTQ